MKKTVLFVAFVALVAGSACQKTDVDPWFEGSYEAALNEAGTRNTLVFAEFYSDT